jgi:hypothetical protein
MTLEQSIEVCRSFSLYGPTEVIQGNLTAWLNGDTTFSAIAYVLNMLNSDNLAWIDCMLSLGM